MARYRFHDLLLDVEPELERRANLEFLWPGLSWRRTTAPPGEVEASLSLHLYDRRLDLPHAAKPLFRTDSFRAFEHEGEFYLTDGDSLLHIQPPARGSAYLAPSFFGKTPPLQDNFWTYGLMKLLRFSGCYCLHTAGLVSPRGTGVLVVGASGSGKTTITLGSIRHGWRSLSDDAVLLRRTGSTIQTGGHSATAGTITALALRTGLYVDAGAAAMHRDLVLGKEVPDGTGGHRRRVYLDSAGSRQKADSCTPRLLVFPRITGLGRSELSQVDTVSAFKRLLAASGPQLWDSRTMAQHMNVLGQLVRQATAYELSAGLDVCRDPSSLLDRLQQAAGDS